MVYCRHVWKSEIAAPVMPFCESKMVFPGILSMMLFNVV